MYDFVIHSKIHEKSAFELRLNHVGIIEQAIKNVSEIQLSLQNSHLDIIFEK